MLFNYSLLKSVYNGIRQPVNALFNNSTTIALTTFVGALTVTIVYPLAHIYSMNTEDAEYGRAWSNSCLFPSLKNIFFSDANSFCDYNLIEFAFKTNVFDQLPYVTLFGAGFGFFSSCAAVINKESVCSLDDKVIQRKLK
jgi:hypothetical protein